MEIVTKVMEKSWKFVGKNVYEPCAWKLGQGGTKKSTRYQVLYPVENPPKFYYTEPYRAIPCSGKVPLFTINYDFSLYKFLICCLLIVDYTQR